VRLDRLGRSLRELFETVEMLKERGIALMSLEQSIDVTSVARELVFHLERFREAISLLARTATYVDKLLQLGVEETDG
jgi:DNA invertase Pin-like site-specific DNA recombinase